MEIKRYIRLLLRWSWLLVLLGAIGAGVAYQVSQQLRPGYEATTTVLVDRNAAKGLLTSDGLPTTFATLLRKRAVLDGVIAELQLPTTADELAKHVRVTIDRDTQLVSVTVDGPEPKTVTDIANAIPGVFNQQNRDAQLDQFAEARSSIERELNQAQQELVGAQVRLDALADPVTPRQVTEQIRLRVLLDQHTSTYESLVKRYQDVRLAETEPADILHTVEVAHIPVTSTTPKVPLNTALGGILGLMLALAAVVLLELTNDRIRLPEDAQRALDAPALAVIPLIGGASAPGKLVTVRDLHSPGAEAYRMLNAALAFSPEGRAIRTVVVASGSRGEGRSTTAANLAATIAQTGKQVILVDSDLHGPTLHAFFAQANVRGLATALAEQTELSLDNYLVPTGIPNLTLLPAGSPPANPAALVASDRMRELIEQLAARAEVVIFDTPPLLPFVEASLLAHRCDLALLVVRAGSTHGRALERAGELMSRAGAPRLGLVINAAARPAKVAYYYNLAARGQPAWRRVFQPILRRVGRLRPVASDAGMAQQPPSAPDALAGDGREIARTEQLAERNGHQGKPSRATGVPAQAERPGARAVAHRNKRPPSGRRATRS